MNRRRHLIALTLLAALAGFTPQAVQAQPRPEADGTLPPDKHLFAVELRTGAAWDAAKPPQEQAHFREHAANLARLRREGHLLLGARYGDKGLVVLMAGGEAEARAMIEADPAVQARVFAYELHPMAPFYPGAVPGRRRAAPPAPASAPRP